MPKVNIDFENWRGLYGSACSSIDDVKDKKLTESYKDIFQDQQLQAYNAMAVKMDHYILHGGESKKFFDFPSPKNLNIPKLEAKNYSEQSQSAMELGRRIHEAELTWKYDSHGTETGRISPSIDGGHTTILNTPNLNKEPKMNQNDFSNDLEAVVRGLHGLSKHAVEAKNDVIKKMQIEIDTLKQQLNIQQSETGNRAEGERYWQNQAENARRNERKIYQDNEQLEEILSTLQVDIMMHLNKET